MAQPQVILALDSGSLILAGKDGRVEAIIRKWLRQGARLLVPAPSIAESIRDRPQDASINRIIRAIDNVANTTEAIARDAGARLASNRSKETVDALIVATAFANSATDILTTDADDIRKLADPDMNIIVL
jgi:hypothetical protein